MEDRTLLEKLGYHAKLDKVDEAILTNATFLSEIIADPEIFGHNLDTDIDDHAEEGSASNATAEHNRDPGLLSLSTT